MNRFFINVIFILLFFTAPIWLLFIAGMCVLLLAPFKWYECVIFGLLFDIVSGGSLFQNLTIPSYTLVAIGLYYVALIVRKRMSFHV